MDPESVDDAACTVLHADMDAFFAEVELLRRPELRGRPMMVAGGTRGVVLSATYEAREFGVRSAMPTGRAVSLCPPIVVLPPDHQAYRAASAAVMEIFRSVTPAVQPLSVDEAFLDVSGVRRLRGRPGRIAQEIREQIRQETGLPCTVGAAATKFMAKLASGLAKPDGLLVVPPEEVIGLLHPLPVSALWGVGGRTAERLHGAGIRTVGEVASYPPAALAGLLGAAGAHRLQQLAMGLDEREVEESGPEQSISADHTLDIDSHDEAEQLRVLLELVEKVARRLRSQGMVARGLAVRVRFADFRTVQRSVTLPGGTDVTGTLYTAALTQYRRSGAERQAVRLVGVRLEGLTAAVDSSEQLELGASEGPGWREAESVVDRLVDRFGAGAVRRAGTLQAGDSTRPIGTPRSKAVGKSRHD